MTSISSLRTRFAGVVVLTAALLLPACARTHTLSHPGPARLLPDDRAILLASAPAIAAFSVLDGSPLCLNTALAAADSSLSRELATLMRLPHPPVAPGGYSLGCNTAWRTEPDTLPGPNTTVLILRHLERRAGSAYLSLGARQSSTILVSVDVRLRRIGSRWVVMDTLAFFM